MKNFLFLLVSLKFTLAFASGSHISNGGKGVACFEVYTSIAVKDGKITNEGRKTIRSVEPLEYYLAKNNFKDGSLFQQIEHLSFDQALQKLHNVFKVVPEFYETFINAAADIGLIHDGSMILSGLKPTNDSLDVLDDPDRCAVVQITVTNREFFITDVDLWRKMTPAQRAVLQLHEEVYYFMRRTYKRNSGARFIDLYSAAGLHQEGSSAATRMIADLLMNSQPETNVKRILEKSGFKVK